MICNVGPWKRLLIGDHGVAARGRDGDRKRRQIGEGTATHVPTGTSLLSLLPPSSGVFPTVPPTRVGLRPESGIPTLADRAPSAVGLVGVGLLAMLRYPGMANW